MLIYVIEVEGEDETADESRTPTGRMWVATSEWIANHFQPASMVFEIECYGQCHITRTIADDLGLGSEPTVKVLT